MDGCKGRPYGLEFNLSQRDTAILNFQFSIARMGSEVFYG